MRLVFNSFLCYKVRGGSRTAASSKIERSVIIVNGWKPLTFITKRSILDVAAVLAPPLKVQVKIKPYKVIVQYSKNQTI